MLRPFIVKVSELGYFPLLLLIPCINYTVSLMSQLSYIINVLKVESKYHINNAYFYMRTEKCTQEMLSNR